MSRRMGAVGTLIWDRIWHPASDKEPVEQLGGAAYSLSALAAACPDGWSIHPVMKVGADLWSTACEWLEPLPNVHLGPAVQRVAEPNNRVELRYHDDSNRCEMLTGGVSPWSARELIPLTSGLDAIYLNFISGLEMDLETTTSLRERFEGPLYADLHSLFLGPPGHGPRRPRPLPDWRAWMGCFDVVQMNESELALLAIPGDALREVLEAGPSLVVVTRGAAPALFATRSTSGVGAVDAILGDPSARGSLRRAEVVTGEVPTPAGQLSGDPTGCGDVYGATLFARLLAGEPTSAAMVAAHRAAAAKMSHRPTHDLHLALASSTAPERVLP